MQSGVVPIIKPPGLTSQQVVSIFRRLTGVKKAGHTGTLDPAASGLLVVCFGEATRLIEYADRYPKSTARRSRWGGALILRIRPGLLLAKPGTSALGWTSLTTYLTSL